MRRNILLITGVLIAQLAHSQALQKGNIDIHAGLGFGVYGITSNDYVDNKTTGVPGLLSLGAAYQLSDAFSIGANYERNGFATEADSNNKAVSHNFGLIGAYNFVNSDKNVLNVSLEIGFSSFRYDDFRDEEYVVGTGPKFELGLGWKHYFGDAIGMYMNMGIPYYTYTNFSNDSGENLKVTLTNANGVPIDSRVFEISAVGVNFRLGLLVKL